MKDFYFLGPKGENSEIFRLLWMKIFNWTMDFRKSTFPQDGSIKAEGDQSAALKVFEIELEKFFSLLSEEVPTFSTRYMGHMISDVSMPALIGHASILFSNPNLASKEVARAGIRLEIQAINSLAKMVGYEEEMVRGHFTSGGTMANFEALWRARYRMDHWLALTSYLLEKGLSDEHIFSLAHMGWERFFDTIKDYGVDDEDLRQRSYVIMGPWEIAKYYREKIKKDFPRPIILVPGNKHYSWPKSANVFGLSERAVWGVELDKFGRLSLEDLKRQIELAREQNRPIMMTVSVAGSTELGGVDAVDEVQDLLDNYKSKNGIHIWHHVDAAYGGYFCSTFKNGKSQLSEKAVKSFEAISQAESVTLDPHKLGYVPYSCGAVLVKNPHCYSVSNISAPYLNEDKNIDYPTWSTTLEGSRSATGAGAVWLSSKILPLDCKGHGSILNESVRLKKELSYKLKSYFPMLFLLPGGDTNILSFVISHKGCSLKEVNNINEKILNHFVESPSFAVSRTALKSKSYKKLIAEMCRQWDGDVNDDELIVVRMVIMNPYLEIKNKTSGVFDEFLNELAEAIEKHGSESLSSGVSRSI